MEFKHTKKRQLYYDKVIQIYKETGFGRSRIAMMVPEIERTTIGRWIANFVAENEKASPMTVMQKPQEQPSVQDQNDEVKALQQRVKELEAQLLQAEIKAEFYDEMINVAEAKFKIPIRKKAGAKQ